MTCSFYRICLDRFITFRFGSTNNSKKSYVSNFFSDKSSRRCGVTKTILPPSIKQEPDPIEVRNLYVKYKSNGGHWSLGSLLFNGICRPHSVTVDHGRVASPFQVGGKSFSARAWRRFFNKTHIGRGKKMWF